MFVISYTFLKKSSCYFNQKDQSVVNKMNTTLVLAMLPLFVVVAHSFPWDIVVGREKRLELFYNGTVTHTEDIPSAHDIASVTYDPVHFRVLFFDHHNTNMSIRSFDLTTKKMQTIVTRPLNNYYKSLAYDPVTQLLFWNEEKEIYSLLLKPASSNKVDLLVTSDYFFGGVAVDSCRGFIYWITEYNIERATFDGSKKEVLINDQVYFRWSLAIDQQKEKMYWIDETTYQQFSIESADLSGKNRRTFYYIGYYETWAAALTVSKDFIYWWSSYKGAILQLPKHQQHGVAPVVYSQSTKDCESCQLIAANYTIEEQTLGIKSCETLKSLILDVEERHGSICHNYCFQGNCSVSAEGHPKCSCNRGYSGERCEVDACHKHCFNDGVCSLNVMEKPVCQCTADYQGERCDVSICKDYCMQGNCSVTTEGQRTCSCEAGYSGERCEVHACYKHCLHGGVCSLNEEEEPICQCQADHDGERCDVATTQTGATGTTGACVRADQTAQQILLEVKQVREDLKCTLQLYSDKLDENAAKIQICEESVNEDQQNHKENTSKTQTSSIKF